MKSEKAKKFTEYYRQKRVTGTYDAQREGNAYRLKKRALELRYFLDLISKREKEKVLELGCSSGFLTKYLGNVTAIDTSTDMLEITRNKNPDAKCIGADMFEMPFKNHSFDKIVTMRVWNHLDEEDLRRALKEVKRVLKANGALIFDAEDKSFFRRLAAFVYQGVSGITGFEVYQYSLNDLKKILEEEGFKIEVVKYLKHRVGRQILLRVRSV